MVKLLTNKTCTYDSSHTRTCPEKFCQRAESNEIVLYNCTINYPKKPEYDNLFRDKGQFDPNLIHIMIPSRGRPDTARLNYNHMMIENNQVSAYVQIVFVCPDEFEDYKKVVAVALFSCTAFIVASLLFAKDARAAKERKPFNKALGS